VNGEVTVASSEIPPPLQKATFPCAQCGAALHFAPGEGALQCPWCGHESSITDSGERIREYDLKEAVRSLQKAERAESDHEAVIHCDSCGAGFRLETNVHSGECPFCGSPVVTATDRLRLFKPRSLLPFRISRKQAREAFRGWIGDLWFAPGAIARHAREEGRLAGIYLPYWTYDSQTATRYQGERGTTYYVRVRVPVVVNGRRTMQTRRVPRIRWRGVSGVVGRHFDDVLIGATNTLPRTITDRLQPWDLENLVPYKEDYLSGFRSEVYQIKVDEGFEQARRVMDGIIRGDVRRDIGGDHQRITHLHTRHSDMTFKHLLLPVWAAAFRYREKSYRFVINGRTGKVQGERPYSWIKIGLAIIAGTLIAAGTLWALNELGMFQGMSYGPGTPTRLY
jgi:predicted RNA-binding Zn-ribbon protein involved in translation (DUF1610 family)